MYFLLYIIFGTDVEQNCIVLLYFFTFYPDNVIHIMLYKTALHLIHWQHQMLYSHQQLLHKAESFCCGTVTLCHTVPTIFKYCIICTQDAVTCSFPLVYTSEVTHISCRPQVLYHALDSVHYVPPHGCFLRPGGHEGIEVHYLLMKPVDRK